LVQHEYVIDLTDPGETDLGFNEQTPSVISLHPSGRKVTTYMDSSSDAKVQPYYSEFRVLREIVIRKHKTSKMKLKLDAFLQPVSQPKPTSSQPSTFSANGFNISRSFPRSYKREISVGSELRRDNLFEYHRKIEFRLSLLENVIVV
jgi:hypothetical protein